MKMKSSILKLKGMRSITSYAKRRKLDMSDLSDYLLDIKDIKSTSNDQSSGKSINDSKAVIDPNPPFGGVKGGFEKPVGGLLMKIEDFQFPPFGSNGTSTGKCHWNSIDWPRAYKMVKNLRFRIFKATKRGDVKTVRRLQRLLIRSYENRILAVRQISQINAVPFLKSLILNSTGLDKFTITTSRECGKLVDILGNCSISKWKPSCETSKEDFRPRGYKTVSFKKLRMQSTGRIYIPKTTGNACTPNTPSVTHEPPRGVKSKGGGSGLGNGFEKPVGGLLMKIEDFQFPPFGNLPLSISPIIDIEDVNDSLLKSSLKIFDFNSLNPPTPLWGVLGGRGVLKAVIDRCFQYIVKSALEPEWEARFEGSTYAFRPGRSCHDALHKIYENCAYTSAEKTWVLNGDLTGCFQNISHEFLQNAIKNFPEKGIIERWLKSGYVSNNVFHHTPSDTPQGDGISSLLANIALHGMHEPLGITISCQGETKSEKGLIRYADNFLVFCKSEIAAKETYVELNKWLSIRGLSLSKEKIKITHVDQGFDFLGATIRRFRISDVKTRLLIKPSKKSILKCRAKLKRLWNQGRGKPINLTIKRLNAFIRDWVNYFRPYASKEVFSSLDNYMFTQAVRFTRRTHPLKSWQWRKKQYFGKFHFGRKDNWVFGEKKTGHFVLRFSWFPIQRHTMVKGDNSFYDPDLSEYWLKRQSNRVSWEFTQKKDMEIASKQKHVCPICKESLYTGEKLHRHLQVPVKDGGPDTVSNIVFLHILCHQQVYKIA